MPTKSRPSFDPKSFLAKVGEVRSIGRYRKDEIVYSQGDPADAVFSSVMIRLEQPWCSKGQRFRRCHQSAEQRLIYGRSDDPGVSSSSM
jgi:hypothetical protein